MNARPPRPSWPIRTTECVTPQALGYARNYSPAVIARQHLEFYRRVLSA
jgi:hypothetical protein